MSDPTGFDAAPAHYAGGREVIDIIRDRLGDAGFIAFCEGNEIKYRMRAGLKGDAFEDLRKARWYREMADCTLGLGPDPRSGRPGFTSYRRGELGDSDKAQLEKLGKVKP